jgi:hypothetical protein
MKPCWLFRIRRCFFKWAIILSLIIDSSSLRIRIHKVTESGSNPDPDPQPYFSLWELSVDRRGRDQLFLSAIHTLQQLKTTFSPQDKLAVIVQTFRAITTGQAETASQTWSMDALLPV